MRARRGLFLAAGATVFVVGAALANLSCGARQPLRGQEAADVDRKLSTYAFIEEGDVISLIVGTRATRYREESPYFPLEICIGNRGLRTLSLTRESFTLVDEAGNRYPVAAPRELIERYDFLDLDRQSLAELSGIIFNKFAAFARYPSKFSPTRQALVGRTNVVLDQVTLPKFGYLLDFLYFPQPESGLLGHRFELFMDAPELQEPVFVKFIVK